MNNLLYKFQFGLYMKNVYDVHRTVCMNTKYRNLDFLSKELGDNSKNLLKYIIFTKKRSQLDIKQKMAHLKISMLWNYLFTTKINKLLNLEKLNEIFFFAFVD